MVGEAEFVELAVRVGLGVNEAVPLPLCVPVAVGVGVGDSEGVPLPVLELLAVLLGLTPLVKEEVGDLEMVVLPDTVVVGVVEGVSDPVPLGLGVGVPVPLSLPVLLGLAPSVNEAVGLAECVVVPLREGVADSVAVLLAEGVGDGVRVGVGPRVVGVGELPWVMASQTLGVLLGVRVGVVLGEREEVNEDDAVLGPSTRVGLGVTLPEAPSESPGRGVPVGMEGVGEEVGEAVGDRVGARIIPLGLAEGVAVGELEVEAPGTKVGVLVSLPVGVLEEVGDALPVSLPVPEGVAEGVAVEVGEREELAVLEALAPAESVVLGVAVRVGGVDWEGLGVVVSVGEGLGVVLPVGEGVASALREMEAVQLGVGVGLGDTVCVGDPLCVPLGVTVAVKDGVGQEGPPGQGVQTEAPGADHAPTGQHTPAPTSEYVLLAQAVQEAAPLPLKLPAAQSTGATVLFPGVAPQAEPAGQGMGRVPHMKNPEDTQVKLPFP